MEESPIAAGLSCFRTCLASVHVGGCLTFA
jgi:hypothetical protein